MPSPERGRIVVRNFHFGSDPQALTLAAQAMQALNHGVPVADVTLAGTATQTAGSWSSTGQATFKALAAPQAYAKARADFSASSQSEIRTLDTTGHPIGTWTHSDGVRHSIALAQQPDRCSKGLGRDRTIPNSVPMEETMFKFNNVGCLLLSLILGAALVPMEGAAQGADVSAQRTFTVGHSIRGLNVPGTLGENRPVDVHLWYPARSPDDCDNSDNSDGNGDNQGCSMTPSVYTSRLYGIPLLPQWDPLSWTIGSSVSFENLPIARGHRRFPVIVFSHGNQGNAIDYVYTLEALASSGFIVAAPDHVNNTQDDVRIDFINSQAKFTLISCFDGLPSPCSRLDVPKSMTDRVHDISAIIDALPTWFGDRADISRVGVMGHSRGTVTALAAAGGSTAWGFAAEPRVKAIMGLAIGAPAITFGANVQDITVPALLVAGELDITSPPEVSQKAFDMLASTDKQFVLVENAKHRHFDSGLCAQTQSSGAISEANSRAILDLQTSCTLVTSRPSNCTNVNYGPSGVAMDFCGFETFTNPTDIRPLVASLTGFNVTPNNVPTTGLDSNEVDDQVTELAVSFFGRVLGLQKE